MFLLGALEAWRPNLDLIRPAQLRGLQNAGLHGPAAGGQPPAPGPHGMPIGGQFEGPHEIGAACAFFTTTVLSTTGAA